MSATLVCWCDDALLRPGSGRHVSTAVQHLPDRHAATPALAAATGLSAVSVVAAVLVDTGAVALAALAAVLT